MLPRCTGVGYTLIRCFTWIKHRSSPINPGVGTRQYCFTLKLIWTNIEHITKLLSKFSRRNADNSQNFRLAHFIRNIVLLKSSGAFIHKHCSTYDSDLYCNGNVYNNDMLEKVGHKKKQISPIHRLKLDNSDINYTRPRHGTLCHIFMGRMTKQLWVT